MIRSADRRISLRRNGATTGLKCAVSPSMSVLLEIATRKLSLPSPARRIFDSDGDEIFGPDEYALIQNNDVLYVSVLEDFIPPSAPVAPPAVLAEATAPQPAATAATSKANSPCTTDTIGPAKIVLQNQFIDCLKNCL